MSSPKRASDGEGKRPKALPFYQAPDHVNTSAKIISDARSSLGRTSLKSVNTQRPETPQDGQRKLFGDQSVRDPTNRPPSAFSLGSRHFDSDSRPLSGQRLVPLDHKPRTPSIDSDSTIAPKPPADPNRSQRRPSSRQRLYHQSMSVEGLSSPTDPMSRPKSGSLSDVSEDRVLPSSGSSPPSSSGRRVHSGPKERTRYIPDDQAENTEAPRAQSRRLRSRGSLGSAEGERVENGYVSDQTREGSAGSQRASSAGKPGSGGRREEETAEEALYYNTHIAPIVDEMTKHLKDKDPDKLVDLSIQLYRALEAGNLLGKACKRRPAILKTVFKLLDLDSPKLLLHLAMLIFALKVSGNNLVNVCKLVFKVSRDDKNDNCFLENNILDLLIDTVRWADHVTSADALVYCVGALKFLSGNTAIVKQLVKKQSVDALAKLLTNINKTNMTSGSANETLGHILVQLTATLRNIADVSGIRRQFLSYSIVEELGNIMTTYSHDGDLMMNVARIYSKLTLHTDCCSRVSSHDPHFTSFLYLLNKYLRREDLVVRISFVLGNLTAKDDSARQKLFSLPKARDTIIGVFRHYCEQDLKLGETEQESSSSKSGANKTEDVLIKIIRVIANLSINENIGNVLACHDDCVELLLLILENKSLEKSEELVLNTMATVNNLSYYNLHDSAITQRHVPLATCMMRFMTASHMEGLAEATRVYGNLSRHRPLRDFLVSQKVDEAVVAMLDSGDREVVFTACGVLINLLADEDKRHILNKSGGVHKLVDVLRDFARSDWQLASLVCQTLWNYSAKITSVASCFGEEDGAELHDLLVEYLDEEAATDNADFDEAMQEYIKDVWESEFCPVASKLLQRIEAHTSHFEPLEAPS